ncbi:MAG: hypothetical protein ACI4J2_00690 [Ruminococcus sp.]
MKISYIHEPTDLQCGQAVLAMVLGKTVDEIVEYLGNDRETNLKEMKTVLRKFGINISDERCPAADKSDLPELCLLSLETPRCWHWSLYHNGTFYDPEHGIMNDFPVSNRRYYWKLTE